MSTIGKQLAKKDESHISGAPEVGVEVDGCTVTLRFATKNQELVMTEIKRMIIFGHSHANLQNPDLHLCPSH